MRRSAALSSVLFLSLALGCGSPETADPPQPGPDEAGAAAGTEPALRELAGTWDEQRRMRGAPAEESQDAREVQASARPVLNAAEYGGAAPAAPAATVGFFYESSSLAASGEDDRARVGSAQHLDSDEDGNENRPRGETWKPEAKQPNATALRVGDGEELPLLGAQASVTVAGHRARVVLDLFWFNDRDRQLEGEFVLRLPDGASPYYLAFGAQTDWRAEAPPGELMLLREDVFLSPRPDDVPPRSTSPDGIRIDREGRWIEPREARVVPREKAAHAYTETVRREVDPALLEWAGAGVFRARLFPLQPGELHRVVLGYELDLALVGADRELVLELPADAEQVAVDLAVDAAPRVTVLVEPTESAAAASPIEREWSWREPEARSFRVRLVAPPPTVLRGRSDGGEDLFAVAFEPKLAPAQAAGGHSRAVFLLDTSLSSAPDRFPIFLALLERVLAENRDSIREFAVLEFDVERRWWRAGFAANAPGEVAAFLAHADGIALEGATDVAGALAEAARPEWGVGSGSWDVFLLSDAAPTWGEDDVWALSRALAGDGAGALFGYSTGLAGTDRRVLDHLARETGGAVFSVSGAAEVAAAAVAHRARPARIEGVRVAGCRDLLLAGRPRALYPGQVLTLAGRGAPPAGAVIELDVERDGRLETLRVSVAHALDSELAARAFGEVAVAQLEGLGGALEAEARAFATHFRVPGETCSLLMLESEEDYQRFGIVADDDARVVRSAEAAQLVELALSEHAAELGDPRRSFLAHVERLEQMPGLAFEVSEALEAVFADLPLEIFAVRPEPLRSASRAKGDVPAELAAELAAGAPDYDALQAEAVARRESRGHADALRLVSSLVELAPGDGIAARDVAYSAMELGYYGHAYHLLRRVAKTRPWEPQTYHAMARCLDAADRDELALAWYEVALLGTWDGRFGEFREIVAVDYLHFLRGLDTRELDPAVSAYAATRRGLLSETVQPQRADLLVTIDWNTDATDVDLHVIEPTGEECFYSHPDTAIGGHLTRDVTQGYGPEMYVLSTAPAGEYAIGAHYFSSNQNRAGVRSKVHAVVYLGWGTPEERRTEKVVSLVRTGDMHPIGLLELR